MDQIPASIPFHVARAYGVSSRPATQIEAKPSVSKEAKASSIASTAKLVAAVVGGPVRFGSAEADGAPRAQGADSFQLYRHPADKNAAATSIDAGRKIDRQA